LSAGTHYFPTWANRTNIFWDDFIICELYIDGIFIFILSMHMSQIKRKKERGTGEERDRDRDSQRSLGKGIRHFLIRTIP
jgi:hypothetical protein